MRIVVFLAVLVFSAVVFADQPEPIRPDPKLTPSATFDVTLQDISEPPSPSARRSHGGQPSSTAWRCLEKALDDLIQAELIAA